MMHLARRGACKGTSRGVLVLEGVNAPPSVCVDKTLLVTNCVQHKQPALLIDWIFHEC